MVFKRGGGSQKIMREKARGQLGRRLIVKLDDRYSGEGSVILWRTITCSDSVPSLISRFPTYISYWPESLRQLETRQRSGPNFQACVQFRQFCALR